MEFSTKTTTTRRQQQQQQQQKRIWRKKRSTTFLFGFIIGNGFMLTMMNMILWYHHPVDIDVDVDVDVNNSNNPSAITTTKNSMRMRSPPSSSSTTTRSFMATTNTTNTATTKNGGDNNQIENNDSDDDDDDDDAIFDEIQCNGLNGTSTRILLLEVHLEGNLGDELETTPLLYLLKKKCGIHITAVLSSWLETPSEQLGYRSIRAHQYIDTIKSFTQNFVLGFDPNNYDAILLAPGPWRLCKIAKNWYPHHIDILVGGTIIIEEEDDDCNFDHKGGGDLQGGEKSISIGNNNNDTNTNNNIDTYLQQLSVKLFLARETYTYNMVRRHQSTTYNTIKTFLSGDLTNSILPLLHQPSIEYWKRIYKPIYKNSILIFSRASNIDKVVEIVDMTVRLKTFGDNGIVAVSKNFVFATSSGLEDATKFNDWKHKYNDRFMPHQYVVCQSMEQLIALIGFAKHVYTDRYHPGVVAHMLGKQFTILEYTNEQSKLIGLSQLVATVEGGANDNNNTTTATTSNSVTPNLLHEYNTKAMALILETIQHLKQTKNSKERQNGKKIIHRPTTN